MGGGTDGDMASCSIHNMKGFEILTREVPLLHPSLIYIWDHVKVKYWQVTWAWNSDLKQDEMVTTDIKMS